MYFYKHSGTPPLFSPSPKAHIELKTPHRSSPRGSFLPKHASFLGRYRFFRFAYNNPSTAQEVAFNNLG